MVQTELIFLTLQLLKKVSQVGKFVEVLVKFTSKFTQPVFGLAVNEGIGWGCTQMYFVIVSVLHSDGESALFITSKVIE